MIYVKRKNFALGSLLKRSFRRHGAVRIYIQTIAPLRGACQGRILDRNRCGRGRFVRLRLGEDVLKFPFLGLAGFHEKTQEVVGVRLPALGELRFQVFGNVRVDLKRRF